MARMTRMASKQLVRFGLLFTFFFFLTKDRYLDFPLRKYSTDGLRDFIMKQSTQA